MVLTQMRIYGDFPQQGKRPSKNSVMWFTTWWVKRAGNNPRLPTKRWR